MSEVSAVEATLVEIFASAQGEGPEVGRSTVFVRFGGCDLRCRWCDSPGTWRPTSRCRIETAPGSGEFVERANPIALDELADIAVRLAPRPATWISLTGGEPLLQPDAVAALAAMLAARDRRVYLETHGLHAEALLLRHILTTDGQDAVDLGAFQLGASLGAIFRLF